jgi:hypothetical protein
VWFSVSGKGKPDKVGEGGGVSGHKSVCNTPRRLILQTNETNISGRWPAELAEFMMDGGDLFIFVCLSLSSGHAVHWNWI